MADTLTFLRPSDLLSLQQVNRALFQLIISHESHLAATIIAARYPAMVQCFRLPILQADLDPEVLPYVRNRIYAHNLHVAPAPRLLICSCTTCHLRWVALSTIVDFAHWRRNLDTGDPIPMVPRGQTADWAKELLKENARVVSRALVRPLWHARILEAHLRSMVSAVRRHGANPGNQRKRFRLTAEDIRSESDAFLEREGPPTTEVPFHRDNYYMLEAFMPNRSWFKDRKCWMYNQGLHEWDLGNLVRAGKQALWDAQTPVVIVGMNEGDTVKRADLGVAGVDVAAAAGAAV
jgi:hypothetical protein